MTHDADHLDTLEDEYGTQKIHEATVTAQSLTPTPDHALALDEATFREKAHSNGHRFKMPPFTTSWNPISVHRSRNTVSLA